MIVCKNCVAAIRSHEGRVYDRPLDYADRIESPDVFVDDDTVRCEWCNEEVCVSDAVWIDLE